VGTQKRILLAIFGQTNLFNYLNTTTYDLEI